MPSIALITTGDCEHRALGPSLRRVFPHANLGVWTPLQPIPSITCNYVSYPGPMEGPTRAGKLVRSVVATLGQKPAPDLIFVVDDLEVPNLDTPHHVTQLVSDAFRRETNTTLAQIGDRCSFHLLCPMVEAYFFGELAALTRAGAEATPLLGEAHLEDFLVGDMTFLAKSELPGHSWRRPDRGRHPKRYLSYLRDPRETGRHRYRETEDGVRALETLDWAQVFAYEPQGIAFAHALFEDLADALGVANPFPGTPHPLTRRRTGGTLRNVA